MQRAIDRIVRNCNQPFLFFRFSCRLATKKSPALQRVEPSDSDAQSCPAPGTARFSLYRNACLYNLSDRIIRTFIRVACCQWTWQLCEWIESWRFQLIVSNCVVESMLLENQQILFHERCNFDWLKFMIVLGHWRTRHAVQRYCDSDAWGMCSGIDLSRISGIKYVHQCNRAGWKITSHIRG
jgi:hypothetical protein